MGRVERLAAELHQRWVRQRGYATRLVEDERGGHIDLASTPFAALPAAWQEENLAAARSALWAVAATSDVTDPEQRVEAVAALVHESWVKRNAARDAPDELLVSYARLAEEERGKDRVIAVLALSCD